MGVTRTSKVYLINWPVSEQYIYVMLLIPNHIYSTFNAKNKDFS